MALSVVNERQLLQNRKSPGPGKDMRAGDCKYVLSELAISFALDHGNRLIRKLESVPTTSQRLVDGGWKVTNS